MSELEDQVNAIRNGWVPDGNAPLPGTGTPAAPGGSMPGYAPDYGPSSGGPKNFMPDPNASDLENQARKIQSGYVPPGVTPAYTPMPTGLQFGRGITDPMRGAAMFTAQSGISAPVTGSGEFGGGWNLPPGADSAYAQPSAVAGVQNKDEADYQARRKAAGDTGIDLPRLGGNILSPATLAFPAATAATLPERLGVGAITGGVSGMLAPAQDWNERLRNGLVGMGIGPAVNAAAPMVAGYLSTAQQALKDAGVWLSPGKSGGPLSSAVEALASKFPFIKGTVQTGIDNMLDSFNLASFNQQLQKLPGGMANIIPKTVAAGSAALNYALDKAGDAYNAILPHVSFTPGSVFNDGLQKIRNNLPPSVLPDFETALNQHLLTPLQDAGGTLPGAAMKEAETNLRQEATDYFTKGSSVAEGKIGQALNQVRDLMHQQVGQDFSPFKGALDAVDNVYAHIQILKEAAVKAIGDKEVPTPLQVLQTIRSTSNKTAVARGGDDLQKFATAAQDVIGSSRSAGKSPASASDVFLSDVLGTGLGATAALGGSEAAGRIPEDAFPGATYLKYGLGLLSALPLARRMGTAAFGPASYGRTALARSLPAGAAMATPGLLGGPPPPATTSPFSVPLMPAVPGGLLGPGL